MKHLVFTLLAALVFSGAASAQRLMVGVRGGVNFADYSFVPTRIGDTRFTPGAVRAGYDVGFVLRLNLSKHLHLQSELNYAFVNYNVLAENSGSRRIALRTERFEIPVQLGFQFGVLRLFGGALFRVTESERSSVPQLLKVRFNNGDVGVMGGLGFNVRKFFIDFRISGYPRSRVWHDFTSEGIAQRVKVPTTSSTAGPWDFSSDTVAENVPARRAPPQQAANRAFIHTPKHRSGTFAPPSSPRPGRGFFTRRRKKRPARHLRSLREQYFFCKSLIYA